jgi:hypothetical protein
VRTKRFIIRAAIVLPPDGAFALAAFLAVVAFLAWSTVQDARQDAALNARFREAGSRDRQANARMLAEGRSRASPEEERLSKEYGSLYVELQQRRGYRAQSLPARLYCDFLRCTGW